MRYLLVVLMGAVTCLPACDAFLKLNPSYCEDSSSCAAGTVCDVFGHSCVDPQALDPLELTAVTPSQAGRGGGAMVTVKGQGFRPGAQVSFEDVDATAVSYVSPTELLVTVPAGVCGPSKVEVRNVNGEAVERANLFGYHVDKLIFQAGASVAAGTDSNWISSGLINADREVDLLMGYGMSPGLQQRPNDGLAGFPGNTRFTSDYFVAGEIRDLDGDGSAEYLVRNYTKIMIWKASTETSAYQIDIISRDMAIVDANLDGKLDIVALNSTGDMLLTYLQSGSLSFGNQVGLGIPIPGKYLLVSDFNNDGKEDVIVSAPDTSQIRICLATTDGTTSCNEIISTLVGGPTLLAAVDLDRKGRNAMVGVTTDGGAKVSILGFDDDNPHVLQTIALRQTPTKLLTQDVDCDGLRDIILYNQLGMPTDIYLNQGEGSFTAQPTSIQLVGGAGLMAVSLESFKLNSTDDMASFVTLSKYSSGSNMLQAWQNVSQ